MDVTAALSLCCTGIKGVGHFGGGLLPAEGLAKGKDVTQRGGVAKESQNAKRKTQNLVYGVAEA
jgi:hypothetical protein